MANGMPSWDEWDGLTEDQRNYKKYEVLVAVTKHLAETCPARVLACNGRISALERRKRLDTAAAAGGGFLGGIVAMAGRWLIGK